MAGVLFLSLDRVYVCIQIPINAKFLLQQLHLLNVSYMASIFLVLCIHSPAACSSCLVYADSRNRPCHGVLHLALWAYYWFCRSTLCWSLERQMPLQVREETTLHSRWMRADMCSCNFSRVFCRPWLHVRRYHRALQYVQRSKISSCYYLHSWILDVGPGKQYSARTCPCPSSRSFRS